MPLDLSPYVTSTPPGQDAWSSRRPENDRPSPLRISKPPSSTDRTTDRLHQQHPVYPARETTHPLQKQSANRLNIAKRRSLWALSSRLVEDEELRAVPPRPCSVGPNVAFDVPFPVGSGDKSEIMSPRTAEEAEDMLREASRTYSGASDNSNSWNSFVSGGCSLHQSLGTRSSSSVIRHVSSSTDSPNCTINMDSILPHVLSPHISIHTNGHSRYFGQDHVWATIEVSGILSHAYSADGTGAKPAQPKADEHHLDLFFKHGCLHDLKVEILPVEGTIVLQVFHEQSFPTILYAGSKVLLLAQICIDSKSIARQTKAPKRQNSEELMADLESQLGDSQMPYMKVRITYSHSAFSDYFGHEILVGVAQRCTRLETTAIGALKRHNVRSAWSPPPIYTLESIQSVMQRHWKADVVAEWLERIKLSERYAYRKSSGHRNVSETSSQDATPKVPIRRPGISMEDMCQRMTASNLSVPRDEVQSPTPGGERRDKKQVLNMGSLRSRPCRSRNTSNTTSTTGSLRKRKSFAAGIWRSLTPSINVPKTDGEESAQGAWSWNAWF
ncbi:ubiquitin-conjugating enzyme [Cordyceps militaris]|uniref:Ubiquitin-conjugating enzyme n=1 Tax=Cordyceps militaris TaxID=73501 RepID=A0A2H4S817_CORMI|nr:ubiquitin-conjugating enzyme [Cordyceps militaris]